MLLRKTEYKAAPEIEVVLVRYGDIRSSVFYVIWEFLSELAL
jgi:hypothetical protein